MSLRARLVGKLRRSLTAESAASPAPARLHDCVMPAHPRVRPWPYPFRAGLAISNDAEYLEFSFFEQLMTFLNTERTTPFGQGLGMEISSSAFFYSAHPHSFSYFSGREVEAEPSAVADRMADYLRSGWMDAVHAYGDFDFTGGCTRAHAVRTYELLGGLGVRLEIFTDHGTAHNVQNIGPGADYHRGDRVGSPVYHADLMRGHGIRYVWTDLNMVDEPSPDDIRTIRAWAANHPGAAMRPAPPLLFPYALQDGSCFLGMRRLRGTGSNAPNLSSLGYQLSLLDWPAFYETHGIVVLYQHLGILERVNGRCRQATVEDVRDRPEAYLAPFRFLARERREGRLWLVSLLRLLRYAEMMADLSLTADGNTFHLGFPKNVDDPEGFFQGLTLYIDPALPAAVTYRGKSLPILFNGPDETGAYSVTVPVKKLADIW